MASGRCEGTVHPWRAPLELTKWSKIRQRRDVCVCVCTCAGICTSVSCMQKIIHTQFLYNLGIYCLEFTMAYIPSFLQLGAHHPHRVPYLHT
jgi:hypothetical protein